MHKNFFRLALGLPFLPAVLEFPDDLLLFGANRYHGLTASLERQNRCINVFELGIAIRVTVAFFCLAIAL